MKQHVLLDQLEKTCFGRSIEKQQDFCGPIRKQQILMGQLGNCMFCSTNSKTAGFDGSIGKQHIILMAQLDVYAHHPQ